MVNGGEKPASYFGIILANIEVSKNNQGYVHICASRPLNLQLWECFVVRFRLLWIIYYIPFVLFF